MDSTGLFPLFEFACALKCLFLPDSITMSGNIVDGTLMPKIGDAQVEVMIQPGKDTRAGASASKHLNLESYGNLFLLHYSDSE